jgi:hypothetical protein
MPDPVRLRALQRRMLRRLTAAVDGAPAADDGADFVRGDATRSAAARLQVYEEMYELRLREALVAYFPQTAAALGDDATPVLRRYLAAHPSHHPSLRQLGAQLPAFLDGPTAALARLELARLDVFDAADEPLLTRAQLLTLAPDAFAALPIALVAAHRLVTIGGEVTLVVRRGVAVQQRRLDALEADLLAHLAHPAPFADVCERIAAHVGDAESATVGCSLLARWVDDQLLRAPQI